jgi:hypothetical protein
LGNLRHLQTLDGRGTNIDRFPSTITKLRKLEHLIASAYDLEGRQQGQEDVIIQHLGELGGSSYSLLRFISAVFHIGYIAVNPTQDHPMDDPGVSRSELMSDGSRGGSSTSSLYHIRMCLARTLFCLSVCLFCWRPQALAYGLNRRDVFNIQSAFFSIVFRGVKAPRGMRKLKALNTLGVINVARSKTTLKELEELTQLCKLGVAGVYSKYSKKFWSAISGHKQLRSLSVKGHGLDSCLGGDLLPPIHLESLKLEGRLVRITDWMHTLQNLLKLQLENTQIDSIAPTQSIGQLRNLKFLDLRWGAFKEEVVEFQGPSSFLSLMALELKGPWDDTKVLVFEEGTMPKLELIHLDNYGVTEMRRLACLPSLKEIRLGSRTGNKLKEKLQSQLQKEDLKRVSLKLL